MKIIIIFGNKLLASGKMTSILINRLNKGIDLYNKNDIFLVTGGRVQQKTQHTEAYCMKKYILERLPKALVLKETRAKSTIENVHYSSLLINRNRIYRTKYKIIGVTSKNHKKKVESIIKISGFNWKIYA
jgi:uncharacterized SAM-binding protein YcdF (DUF218 family)